MELTTTTRDNRDGGAVQNGGGVVEVGGALPPQSRRPEAQTGEAAQPRWHERPNNRAHGQERIDSFVVSQLGLACSCG